MLTASLEGKEPTGEEEEEGEGRCEGMGKEIIDGT